MKYHFLTASTSYYSGNNFKDLLDEENEYQGFVYWHIGTNKRLHKIEKDDSIFLKTLSNIREVCARGTSVL